MKFVLSCIPAAIVLALGLMFGLSGPLPPARSQGIIPHRMCDWDRVTFQSNVTILSADTWTTLVCDGEGVDGCYCEIVWGVYIKDPITGHWVEQGWETSGRMGPYCGRDALKHGTRIVRKFLPRRSECCVSVTVYNRSHGDPEVINTSFLYWTN